MRIRTIFFIWFCALTTASAVTNSPVELFIDSSKAEGEIDLTRYALGQGGLSDKPMFEAHVEQIAQLHPRTIRVFVQEFFDLYPAHGQFHWEKLDKFIENILVTKAKPILALCFKPKVLFSKIDQHIVHPNDYQEWERLIFQLVKHCNDEKKYGIQYWEISNEPDIGEDGGCPYLFQKEDYVIYYQHTAAAIQRADSRAKIGGPALAWYRSEIADALIEHCGKTNTPLDFFTWHVYNSDTKFVRSTIREIKTKLAKYPRLKDCETLITEWNMELGTPNLDPAFQPAFILENTLGFHEEGLSGAAYYHIRDYYVDKTQFDKFESPRGAALIANWWNETPQYDGLWDNQGRVRPSYFAFKLLSTIRGTKISVRGTTPDIHAFAVKNDDKVHLVIWNFSPTNHETITLHISGEKDRQFREISLNATVNQLEIIRQGATSEFEKRPLEFVLAPYGIRWITVSR